MKGDLAIPFHTFLAIFYEICTENDNMKTTKQGSLATILPLCLLLLFLGLEAGGFQRSIGDMAREYHLDAALAGGLVSGQYAIMVIAPLLAGRIADRRSYQTALLAGILCFSCGCLGIQASLRCTVLPAVLLIGAGYSFIECTATALLTRLPCGAAAVNGSQGVFCFGALLAPVLVARFSLPWRFSFLIPGLAALLIFPLFLRDRSARLCPDRQASGTAPVLPAGIFILLCAIFLYGMIENGTAYTLVRFFTNHLHSACGAYALTAFWLAMALGRTLCILPLVRRIPTWCCCLLTFLALVLLNLAQTDILALTAAFLTGLSCSSLWTGIMLTASARAGTHAGTVIGCMSLASCFGGTVSPTLLGIFEKRFGGAIPVLILSMTALLMAVAMFFSANHTFSYKRR